MFVFMLSLCINYQYCGAFSNIAVSSYLNENIQIAVVGWSKISSWSVSAGFGHFTSSSIFNTSDFKVLQSGIYQIFTTITFSGAQNGIFKVALVSNNDLINSHPGLSSSFQDSVGYKSLSVFGTTRLFSGDVVSVYVFSELDQSWIIRGGSESTFCIQFVSFYNQVPGFSSYLTQEYYIENNDWNSILKWNAKGRPGLFKSRTGFSQDVGKFVSICDGIYQFSANILISASKSGHYDIGILLNGVPDNSITGADIGADPQSLLFSLSMSISLKLNIGDSVVIVSRGTESYIVKMQSGFFGILVNEGGSTPGISSMLTAPIVNYGGSWLTIPIPIPTSGYGQFQTPSNSVKSNGRFSFTQTQIFIISAIINVQTSSSSLSLILSLQNDPSTFSNQRTGLFTTNLRTSKNSSYSIAGILELQAGQPLFIYLYLTSPGTYSIQPGSRVCVAAVQQEYESFNVVLPSSVYQTKSNDWVVVDTWSESQKSDSFVFTEKLVSGKYTAMATGIYYLSANVIFKDSNGPIYIMIAVNNQLSKRTALYATKGKPSVVQDSLSVSGALFIKKDSYVNVYVMIENDNSWSIDIDSTFSMVFLGYQTNIFGVTTVLTNSLAYTTSGWFKIGKWKSQPVAGPFFDFGGGFNPDTGDFVAPKAGFYIVSAGIKMVQASAVGSSFTLNVAVNGNPSTLQYQNGIQDYLQNGNVAPTTNDFYSLVVSGLVLVNVGDSINLYIQSVADPSYTISQDSYVSIVFISSTNNLYSSGMQLMLDPTLDQQQSASDWSKVKYWQNNRVSTATGVFSSGNLLKLDSVMGTVAVQETGIYYIFVNLAIAPDLNNYQIAVYTTLMSMTSLITRFSDKDHSQYTMKVYGALYLYKGQELSIRVKPSAANAQWENLRSYSGWSFVRIPPYLPIPSVGAGKSSIDSLPFIKVGYYTRLRNWNVTMSTILGVDGEGLNQRDGVYTVFLDGVYLISSTLVIKTNKSQISIGIKIGINADLSDILVVKSGVGPSYLYPVCSGICTISITQAVQLLVGHTVAIFVQSDALTTYVSELSVFSLKLINPLRSLDGFSCQLLSEILISSSGDQKIVGWSAVESIHYTNSTQANEYIVSKGGIYLAAFNMDLINIYGFISIKQYLGTSLINLFEYYNEGLLPFSLSSATVVSLNVGDVYSLKINALTDNSYSIGKPSSSSLTFIGDDTYGFSAVQFRINNNFYNQSKWYPINGWITNGSSWLFEYGQGFLSRQDYIVEKSGFYFITANIIFDKAQNENVLEMVVVLNKVDTVLYDQKILSLKSSTTSTVRGGVFLNNLDYLQLLIRLSSNNDNLIIKKESSFSIVRIAVYTTLTSMTSLITRFSDKDHSQYTMKVYGALYLYKGQELSIRVKPSAANAQWENLRSYSGWSFVRIPPYLPIPSVGAGKPSIDSLPFIKVGYYTRLRNWNVTMSTILGVDGEGLNQRDGVYTVFLDGVYLISSTLVIKTNKSQISIGIKIGINADLSDILVVKSGVGPSYLYPVCSGICTISITQAVQLLVGHTVAIFVQSDALTTYVSELSVISLKLISPLRSLDGFSCQLLSEILISSSGDQKIVGWSAVESIHYTNSTQANEYIISKGGIYLAAFNMDLINIYGFISIKQYLGTSIINLFEYYNEGLLPFSLSSATVVSLNVGDVYSLKINALSDNSYSIGKPSSSSLTFIGDDTYGFSAVQFRINNNFYNQSKWYPINGWITNGSSWLFEYGQGFLSRQDYIVEKSGFYFITANIIFDKAQNENVLEMVVVLNKVDTVLYDQKILSLKSSTSSTVRGGVFLNNLDYLQLLIRLSSNNDNLIIKKESSFSIVRIGFDTLSTTCVDNGPNILGDLSQKNARLNQGENLNLEISATGSNLTYQWLKNFELLKGMTSQVLKLINLKTSDSGSYTCEAIQNAVRVSSSIAKIIVFDPYPVFLNPSSDYNLTAMENGPKIMNLLSISARTQSNESNFEEMFFDIISGNDLQYFQLFPSRSSTGTTLQRTQQLNREMIKSYQLKIRATNALNPNYITVQLIWITVVDENDNSPRFDKTNYNTSVLEGSPIGTVLIQVHAIDPDEGRNSIIVYSILPLDGSKLFSIDQYTGIITLADKLDANVKSAYMIVVKANNFLGSLNSSYAQVFITITNINKFEPYWLQDTYNVDISELLTPDTQILQLLAADEDFGINALIKYEIVSGNEANLFDVKLTGMLVTKGKLSYDLQNIFLLKIHIQDGGSPPKSAVKNATVTINVLNSKSNNPIFEKSEYITTVMENTSYFDPPFVVKANSLDKKLTIMYSIPPNQNVSEIFDIGILTGIIVLKKPLEFEKATFYKFIVQATATGANAAANANILVKVLDASNNVPFFVDSYKSINIELKTSVGNIVYRVSAVDKDSGMNGVIGYKIKSGNINDIFEIDSTTGDIRINNSLDTNTEHFTLFIIAFYIGRPSIESLPFILDIYITGVNNYAPAFSSSSFTVTLSDTSISNQFVYQLAAIDPDPGPDGYLKYNIISGNSDGLFYIDATGVVRVKPPSGFQFLSQYQLGITAEDSFKPPKVSSIFTLFVRTTPRIFVDNVQLGSYQFQTTISFKDYAYLKNLFMLQVLVQRYAPYESSFLVDSQLAPTTWYEVNTDVNSPKLIRYIAVEKSFPQIRVRRSVVNTNDSFVVVIGENTTCAAIKTKNLPSICNGPLKSGFAYRMQLRVYEAQNSTPIESTFSSPITIPTREMQYSFLTDGSQSDMVALSSAFGAICFLSFLVILIYVCWKQKHEIVYNEHLKVTNKTESMYDHSDKAFSNPSSSNPDTFYAHGERDSIERSKAYTKNESETTKPPRITLSNDGAFDKYSIDETEPSENLYALAEAMSKKHEQEKLQKVQEKERSKNIENKYKKSTVFDVVTQLELKNGKKVLNENMPHSYEQEVTDNDSSSAEYESISSYGQHVSKPKNKFYEDDGSIAF